MTNLGSPYELSNSNDPITYLLELDLATIGLPSHIELKILEIALTSVVLIAHVVGQKYP
jgi:hypothetical protein